MLSRTDARRCLAGLLVGLICAGCAQERPRLRARHDPQPLPRVADNQPAPPLRITAPPAQPAAGTPAQPETAGPIVPPRVPAGPEVQPNLLASAPLVSVQPPAPPVQLPVFEPPPRPTAPLPATRTAVPEPPVRPPVAEPPVKPALPDPVADLHRVHRLATERYATLEAYTATLTRREQVGGKSKPEEVIVLKFRKQPWSVHLTWVGKEAQGREVVYVKGQHENKLHTKVAAGDSMLMRAGSRIALPPDSPLVRSNSRHSVTEAGLGNVIDGLGRLLGCVSKGSADQVNYLGAVSRPEFEAPVEAVEHLIPPNQELPRGGRRLFFFDTLSRLPVLVVTSDERGQEVEYYCYTRLQPAKFGDDDFNPDKLWGTKR